ncbi:MAG: TIGR02677 family protein [Bacillota bacterium]
MLLKPIVELSYLISAQNVARYRCILRYFYEQHQRLRYWLRPEDVYEGVGRYELLDNYTFEQCQKDLDQLVEWKNLIPRHDGGRSSTVEEYLRKKFRYQMTPYSVEIERMVAGLEEIRGYGGSLEPSLLETILEALVKLERCEGDFPAGEAEQFWNTLYESFVKLTQNASDYIASLQSSKAEELMMTEAFLAYKTSLTLYLQNFVQGLQRSAFRIEGLLPQIPPGTVQRFFANVIRDRARKPQIEETLSPQEQTERLSWEWHSLVRWFIGEQGDQSDVVFLEQATKDTIAKVVRCALRIQEKQRSGVSRRRELEHLGYWFFSMDSLEEAHRLAACAFGLYRTRHFQGIDSKGTDQADISMWDVGPNIRSLRSRSRKRSRDSGTQPIKSNRALQAQAKEAYMERRREEEALLRAFVEQGQVVISQLGTVSSDIRHQLLHWIGRCMANQTHQIRTPDGIRITLVAPSSGRRTLLHCDDGDLDMPDFTLSFENLAGGRQGERREGIV